MVPLGDVVPGPRGILAGRLVVGSSSLICLKVDGPGNLSAGLMMTDLFVIWFDIRFEV
jgi:hypothetical protein